MKVALVFLLCALVAFVKASPFAGPDEENDENLEDELYDLQGWDMEDPAINPDNPPKPQVSLENVLEEVLKCFLDEGKGRMRRKCIKRFKEHLPSHVPDKKRLLKCIVKSFNKCTKDPEGHGPLECMMEFKRCLEDMGGSEGGSGNWL